MATNGFLNFANDVAAQIMSQDDYEDKAPKGVTPGIADPEFANKTWHQSALIAAVVGALIATNQTGYTGVNVSDTESVEEIKNKVVNVIKAMIAQGIIDNNGVVKTTGAQDVDGIKTFLKRPVLNGDIPATSNDNDFITYGETTDLTSKAMPTGAVIGFAGRVVPTGFLWGNGASFSQSDQPGLFSVTGTYWGTGDGADTFNIVDTRDRTLWGANSTSDVGGYLSDGLPNVLGNPDIGTWSNKETEPYGAFYQGVIQANTAIPWENDTKNDLVYINFDASKSNAIYGASQRVQSRSVQLLMIIKN